MTMAIRIAGLIAVACIAGSVANPIVDLDLDKTTFNYRDNISFTVNISESYSTPWVRMTLIDGLVEVPCPLIRYPFRYFIQTGLNQISVPTPTCVPPGDSYRVRIEAYPRFERDSTNFTIEQSTAACGSGEYSATGTEPGCLRCPIGTFNAESNQTQCEACPTNTTVSFRGATRQEDCNETVVPSRAGYLMYKGTYYYHSNGGGRYLEDHQHKTVDECLGLCNQQPSCKSFDLGDPDQFQQGDCFLSFDRLDSIKEGDVRSVGQLQLWQKVDRQLSLNIFFRKTPSCHLSEIVSGDGGVHYDEHSPEGCAELCLNDRSCVSFDAGAVFKKTDGTWNDAVDDCFLSYRTRADVSDKHFICDDVTMDYFEQIVPKFLKLDVNYSLISSWDDAFLESTPLDKPTFNYDKEVLSRYDHLVQRNSHAQELQIKIGDILKMTLSEKQLLFVRIEESAEGTTTATVNTGSAKMDAAFDQAFATSTTLNISGKILEAIALTPESCPVGWVSQSGLEPGCFRCPPDTFANNPQTDCVSCPLGTVADAGSSSVSGTKACQPQLDTSTVKLGPFRTGYEWFGWLKVKRGSNPGNVSARVTMTVTQTSIDEDGVISLDGAMVVEHGEDCNAAAACRDPGTTEYFVKGSVNGAQVNINTVSGVGGITDRNQANFRYNDGTFKANVSVVDSNTVLEGTFGSVPGGMIKMYERCYASDESDTFSPGNKFVGTYSCYRRGTTVVQEGSAKESAAPAMDVRPMVLYIDHMDDEGKLTATVHFEQEDGDTGIYTLTGTYDKVQGKITFDAGPNAWVSKSPRNTPARQMIGRLTDSREFFLAQMNANPACACNGTTYLSLGGGTCSNKTAGPFQKWVGGGEGWCFVNKGCPDAKLVHSVVADTYVANCNADPNLAAIENVYQTCTDVMLARVCSTPAPFCESGWSADPIQDRCAKKSTTFPGLTTPQMSWSDANTFCKSQDANMMSVHSIDENRFIFDPKFVGGLAFGEAPESLWFGLKQNKHVAGAAWSDDSQYFFSRNTARPDDTGYGYVDRKKGGLWSLGDGTEKFSFVCWKMPLGRAIDAECACSGQNDVSNFGGYCNYWDGRDKASWCYVSEGCALGVRRDGNELLRRKMCAPGIPTTTLPPTTAPPTPQGVSCNTGEYYDGTDCQTCLTLDACTADQYLLGECDTFKEAPKCASIPDGEFLDRTQDPPMLDYCDVRCVQCSGPDVEDCTECQSPLYLQYAADTSGMCVGDCNRGLFKNKSSTSCSTCTPLDGCPVAWAPCRVSVKCGGFTDTQFFAPTLQPTESPTFSPTTSAPSASPITSKPSTSPITSTPSTPPTTSTPSTSPTMLPTSITTTPPTRSTTPAPSRSTTAAPSPMGFVSASPFTSAPSAAPTTTPTRYPTRYPTRNPSSMPTSSAPTQQPTRVPTSSTPTQLPTRMPTPAPTRAPTRTPTRAPTSAPTPSPTSNPTPSPTPSPSVLPTYEPTSFPTALPSTSPTTTPSLSPTLSPVAIEVQASAAAGGGAMVTIVSVIVVILLLAVVAGVLIAWKFGVFGAKKTVHEVASFENPMYDQVPLKTDADDVPTTSDGYMDVPAAANGDTSGYMDVDEGVYAQIDTEDDVVPADDGLYDNVDEDSEEEV